MKLNPRVISFPPYLINGTLKCLLNRRLCWRIHALNFEDENKQIFFHKSFCSKLFCLFVLMVYSVSKHNSVPNIGLWILTEDL